jgi:hypothetical protein
MPVDDERELGDDGEPHHLALKREPGAGRRRAGERAAEGRADRRADAGDLVLRLIGHDAVILEVRHLLQDLGRGRDGVAAEEHLPLRELRDGGEAERGGEVAGDVPVGAGREARGRHLVALEEELGGLAERVAGLEHLLVRVRELRLLLELRADRLELRLDGLRVEPVHEAEREVVLAARDVLRRQPRALERGLGELVHVHAEDAVVRLERRVLERVRLVARLLEVRLVEGADVDDEHPALLQVREVRLERGGVHRDEHVRRVAGRVDLARSEVDLIAGDAGERAGRRPDLGGIVGEGGEVVPGERGRLGELGAGELHTVAGVADEADGDGLDLLDLVLPRGGLRGHRVLRLLQWVRCWAIGRGRSDRPRRTQKLEPEKGRPVCPIRLSRVNQPTP